MPRSSSLPLLKPCVHQYRIAIKNHPTQTLDSARLMLCPTPRLLRSLPQPQRGRQRCHSISYQQLTDCRAFRCIVSLFLLYIAGTTKKTSLGEKV